MIAGSIARRYARALLEIGVSDQSFEAVGREVNDVAGALKVSPELAAALSNPVFPRSQRRALLDRVLTRLGVSKNTRNFALLLLDRERIGALPDIARELGNMIDQKAGRVKAVVTSSQPLSPLQENQIKKALQSLSGKQVMLERRHDPELLGGVVTQLGDIVYDGSLRTQLERMRDSLTK